MRLSFLAAAFAACAALSSAVHAAKPAEVTMYVMPQCGYCEKMREHFKDVGVTWRERDIATPTIKAEFDAKGGIGTPLVMIGNDVVKGYQPQAVDAALRRNGHALKD
jgi:glutaredoxin